jgi:hypothetical protein
VATVIPVTPKGKSSPVPISVPIPDGATTSIDLEPRPSADHSSASDLATSARDGLHGVAVAASLDSGMVAYSLAFCLKATHTGGFDTLQDLLA